jgi:hypothetical protein
MANGVNFKQTTASLRVLFLAANPVDSTLLRIGYEFRSLQERVAVPNLPLRIDLIPFWATEPERLLEAIARERPTVVHFSGHGESGGAIVLEREDGTRVDVAAVLLGDIFRAVNTPLQQRPIRCVVLNACHSDPAAEAISQSVDVVIGIRGFIADDAAIAFTKEFYGGLADGRSVSNAVQLGRAQMQLAARVLASLETVRKLLPTPSRATSPSKEAYDPNLVVVHAMNGVNLDQLLLGEFFPLPPAPQI